MSDLVVTGQPVSQEELLHAALVAIGQSQAVHDRAVSALHQLLGTGGTQMSLETLTAAAPEKDVENVGRPAAFGVVNLSPVQIYVGWGGRSATAGNGIPIRPRSWMVFPQPVNMLDLAAAASELVTPALALVVRFDRPQPFAAGTLDNIAVPLRDSLTFAGTSATAAPAGTVVAQTSVLTGIFEADVTVSQTGSADDAPTNLQLLNGNVSMGRLIDFERGTELAWPTFNIKRVTLNNAALSVALVNNGGLNSSWSASIVITQIG